MREATLINCIFDGMKQYLAFILFSGLHLLAMSQAPNTAYPSTDTTIYTIVEKQAQFFGGTACLFQHITNYLKRPEGEAESKLAGTVYLTFVIEKNGKASNIKVLRGISGSKAFEEEAVKFVTTMPKCVPAEKNGMRVRAQYNLPLKFRPQEAFSYSVKSIKICNRIRWCFILKFCLPHHHSHSFLLVHQSACPHIV